MSNELCTFSYLAIAVDIPVVTWPTLRRIQNDADLEEPGTLQQDEEGPAECRQHLVPSEALRCGRHRVSQHHIQQQMVNLNKGMGVKG